jgi:hypothetical protein
MKPSEIVISDTVISDQHSAIVLQPGIQALNLPTMSVASQAASILRGWLHPVRSVRSNQLDPGSSQLLIQWITIISSITDQPLRSFHDKSRCESCFHKGDFMRRSRRNVDGDRKTMAVCQRHDLRTFAPLGLSNCPPPFLATTKKPSMKHSDRSRSPRSFKSFASACKIFSSTPSFRHSWKRRWQVAGEGYRSGRSCQAAPVRSTHKMPASTSRLSHLGRPFPSSLGSFSGIKGSRIAHCSSVRSIGHAPIGSMTDSNHF